MTPREKAAMLARLVRQAWERDDTACMRLFGSNTVQMLARDVEFAFHADDCACSACAALNPPPQSGDVEKPEPAAPGLITDHKFWPCVSVPPMLKQPGSDFDHETCHHEHTFKGTCGKPRAAHTQERGQ